MYTKFLHFLESRTSKESSDKIINLLGYKLLAPEDVYDGCIVHISGPPMSGKSTFANLILSTFPSFAQRTPYPINRKYIDEKKRVIFVDDVVLFKDYGEVSNLRDSGFLVFLLSNAETTFDVDLKVKFEYTEDIDQTLFDNPLDVFDTIAGRFN